MAHACIRAIYEGPVHGLCGGEVSRDRYALGSVLMDVLPVSVRTYKQFSERVRALLPNGASDIINNEVQSWDLFTLYRAAIREIDITLDFDHYLFAASR